MSDMRIQNLLQSMRQDSATHKGDYTLSDVRFDLNSDALSSSLKELLGKITIKMNIIAQSAAVEMRVVEKGESGKVVLAYKSDIYEVTIPKDQREQSKDIKAGDKLVLLQDAQSDAVKDLYLFVKIESGQFATVPVNVLNESQPIGPLPEIDAAPPVTAEQKYAARLASLVDLEAKIDVLRALIPDGNTSATSVLRRFTVDLDHPSTQLVVPKVVLMSALPLPLQEGGHIVAKLGSSAHQAGQTIAVVLQSPSRGEIFSSDTPQSLVFPTAQAYLQAADSRERANADVDYMQAISLLSGVRGALNTGQQNVNIAVDAIAGAVGGSSAATLPASARLAHVLAGQVGASVDVPVLTYKGSESRIDMAARSSTISPEIIVVEKPDKNHGAAFQAENLFMSRLHVIDDSLVDDGQLVNNSAATLSVKVIGETPRGEKIVQPEWVNWPARSAMVLGLKENDDIKAFNAIRYGDVLSVSFPVSSMDDLSAISPVAVEEENEMALARSDMAAGVRGDNMVMPKQISPFLVQSAFYADFAKLFDGIAAQSLIMPMQISAAQAGIMIPSLAKPEALPAALLFLVAAMRSGDLSAMLNEKVSDTLNKMGKAEALSKFLKSAASKGAEIFNSKPEQGSAAEWKSVMLPMHAEGQVSAVALHWRDYPSGHNGDDSGGEDDIARFVLDFRLSAMGDVQLDGFFKNNSLNVALRLSELPSIAMQSRITSFYNDALDQMGLGGDMRFQLVADKAMRFVLDQG
jgi:hypothetical protein